MASRPLTATDNTGRAYATLDELHDGQRIELDRGFDCVTHEPDRPTTATVLKSLDGRKYFICQHGRHYLEGQLDDEDGQSLIGVYPVRNGCGVHTD